MIHQTGSSPWQGSLQGRVAVPLRWLEKWFTLTCLENVENDADSKGIEALNFSIDELKISNGNEFNYPVVTNVHTSINISSSSPKECEIKGNSLNSARFTISSLKLLFGKFDV